MHVSNIIYHVMKACINLYSVFGMRTFCIAMHSIGNANTPDPIDKSLVFTSCLLCSCGGILMGAAYFFTHSTFLTIPTQLRLPFPINIVINLNYFVQIVLQGNYFSLCAGLGRIVLLKHGRY